MGIPWCSSGENLVLLLPWAWVQSLVKELRFPQAVECNHKKKKRNNYGCIESIDGPQKY